MVDVFLGWNVSEKSSKSPFEFSQKTSGRTTSGSPRPLIITIFQKLDSALSQAAIISGRPWKYSLSQPLQRRFGIYDGWHALPVSPSFNVPDIKGWYLLFISPLSCESTEFVAYVASNRFVLDGMGSTLMAMKYAGLDPHSLHLSHSQYRAIHNRMWKFGRPWLSVPTHRRRKIQLC